MIENTSDESLDFLIAELIEEPKSKNYDFVVQCISEKLKRVEQYD